MICFSFDNDKFNLFQAWEDTSFNWESLTKNLVSYPKAKLEDGQITESFHRSVSKRRHSHQTTEHELEVQNFCFLQHLNWVLNFTL